MPRTRAKKYSMSELIAMLRRVRWRHFAPNKVGPNMGILVLKGGVKFQARYGTFLNMTGIGIVSEGLLLHFVPCLCPARTLTKTKEPIKAAILGDYDPPWNPFDWADLAHKSNEGWAVHAINDKKLLVLKPNAFVLGGDHAS